jgi:hypothetical protein
MQMVMMYIALHLAFSVVAQPQRLEPTLEAVILAKVLLYDQSVSEQQRSLPIGILYRGSPSQEVKQITKAFRNAKASVLPIEIGQLSTHSGSVIALYIPTDVPIGRVSSWCAENKVLSMSATSDTVRSGLTSVAVVPGNNNRAKIVVNLARMAQEHRSLSSKLLRLAEVVR